MNAEEEADYMKINTDTETEVAAKYKVSYQISSPSVSFSLLRFCTFASLRKLHARKIDAIYRYAIHHKFKKMNIAILLFYLRYLHSIESSPFETLERKILFGTCCQAIVRLNTSL